MTSTKPPPDIARTLFEHISVKPISPDIPQARFNPERQGNTASCSYSGCALVVGVQAACQTVPEGYKPYSVTGASLRRQVEISQAQNDTTRLYVIMLADFHMKERDSLEYSSPPEHIYSKPELCLTPQEIGHKMVQQGIIPDESLSIRPLRRTGVDARRGLTFTPLTHSGMLLDDVAACATLDFVIRA
ncbi:hypothetical protein BDW75DRAFT_247190 [Aspergillus navahoensis]